MEHKQVKEAADLLKEMQIEESKEHFQDIIDGNSYYIIMIGEGLEDEEDFVFTAEGKILN